MIHFPLRVIGDVHGEIEPFSRAIAGAGDRSVVQLGDLVDRGSDSPACLRAALGLVGSGRGLFVRGNHDYKLASSLLGRRVAIGGDLKRTLRQIEISRDRATLVRGFLDAWPTTPWWLLLGRVLFVHGAFHCAMLDHFDPDHILSSRTRQKVKWLALYGESQPAIGNDLSARTYGWIETIPAGLTVIVGHDVRATEAPLIVSGRGGGRAVFVDTGCGKGGRLSCLDLDEEPGVVDPLMALASSTQS